MYCMYFYINVLLTIVAKFMLNKIKSLYITKHQQALNKNEKHFDKSYRTSATREGRTEKNLAHVQISHDTCIKHCFEN